MLEAAGLTVTTETGILFIPGWLRMLDLLLHTRWPPGTFVTRPAVAWFTWLGRRFPGLRRHGYLLASVGERQSSTYGNPYPRNPDGARIGGITLPASRTLFPRGAGVLLQSRQDATDAGG